MPGRFAQTHEPRPSDFAARLPRRARGIAAARTRGHLGRRAIILLSAVAVPAFAAPEDWPTQWSDSAEPNHAGVLPMPFEKPGDSFPGSAFYYLAPDDETRAWSPDGSVPGGDGLFDSARADGPARFTLPGGIARSLRIGHSGVDRSRALQCLTAAIYYEAASEPDAGQRAVAQVVLNRVAHPSYPNTVCGVVYQGSERSTGCQFSFTCDGSLARKPVQLFWQRAMGVAQAALSGHVYVPVGLATHYHTIAVHPYWAPKLAHLGTIGAHRFYKFNGAAGQSATFRFTYLGGEPVAAPHPRSPAAAMPGTDVALDPLAVQRAYAAGTAQGNGVNQTAATRPSVSAAPPVYSEEIRQRGGDALFRGDKPPDRSGIRPEYANSGRWIGEPAS
ncbi:MAG: cell wall hydrolase [Novosphingobium sp.]